EVLIRIVTKEAQPEPAFALEGAVTRAVVAPGLAEEGDDVPFEIDGLQCSLTRHRHGGSGGNGADEYERASAKGEQAAEHGATSNRRASGGNQAGRFRRGGNRGGVSIIPPTFIILTKFAHAGSGASRKKMRNGVRGRA